MPMREIVMNLSIFLVWVVLSTGLARLIYALSEGPGLGASGAVAIWLVGQLVILSPLLLKAWRHRSDGAREELA